jgi:hypothetical protein
VKGVFLGEPEAFYVVWDGQKSTTVSKGTPAAKFRFKINMAIQENGVMAVKIFEQGAKFYNQLKALHEEFNLETTFIKITRVGTGTDTVYTAMPTKDQVNAQLHAELAKLELHDLKEAPQPAKSVWASSDDDEQIPF